MVKVEPSTRQLSAAGLHETLEPRVMQALVALARANGNIVTRDELIERCWDGRIVTDDAINRVLSRIRQIGSGIGGGTFTVETITKVGYRLVARQLPGSPRSLSLGNRAAPGEPAVARRVALTGLAAAGAAALAGGVLWQRPWSHRPPPEAKELFRRGNLAQRAATADQSRQSVSYFEQAVSIDPQYGEAWGALALAYTHHLDGYGEAELASLPGRIRSAAARAMKFDPGNPDAQLALICIKPFFRNWAKMETDLRRLCDRHPRHWLAHGRLAILLYQTGRLAVRFRRLCPVERRPRAGGRHDAPRGVRTVAGASDAVARQVRPPAVQWTPTGRRGFPDGS